MALRCRFEDAGAVHAVWGRGVEKRTIFEDEEDRKRYLALLGDVCERWHWDCLEYCLMGNHFHLVVRTREPTLGKGMHRLHTFYVMHFNQKHERVGPLFQSRFGSARLWTPERLEQARVYVVENPVAAGLGRKPEEWRWSATAARTNGRPAWLATSERLSAIA